MFRAVRIGLAALLSVAVVGAPLMLDHCAASCEMHDETAAGTPACHHTPTTAAHLGHTPGTCGHDHNGTTVTAENGSVAGIRSFAPALAIVLMPLSPAMTAATQTVHTHAPPNPSFPTDHRSLTLRI